MTAVLETPLSDKLDAEWYGRRAKEETLDPDLPIIDSHHHLYIRETGHYSIPQLTRDMTSGHDIRATVYVEAFEDYRTEGPEAMRPVGEVEHQAGLASAAQDSIPGAMAGIVGWADLLLGEGVSPVLEAQAEAGKGRFKGVRTQAQWDASGYTLGVRRPPPGLMLNETYRAGARTVARMGLSLDLLYFHPQWEEAVALADAVPELPIIINHFGWPIGEGPLGTREEVFAFWRKTLPEMARRPNMVMKVGGLGSPWCGLDFSREEPPPTSETLADIWRPYFSETIAAFGPERCMMESNYPVDRKSCSYHTLWNALKRIGRDYSADERMELFSGAAGRAYRLAI